MSFVHSFPPVADENARVLVLGSMPGTASLAAQQYYAHPRNAFWPIMAAICGFDVGLDYQARLASMTKCGIALWDVLERCTRQGSLDRAIEPRSMQVNDFAGFFAAHAHVAVVLCNGATAFQLFRQQVARGLRGRAAGLPCLQVPSTSPAHASLGREQKLAAWRRAVGSFVS